MKLKLLPTAIISFSILLLAGSIAYLTLQAKSKKNRPTVANSNLQQNILTPSLSQTQQKLPSVKLNFTNLPNQYTRNQPFNISINLDSQNQAISNLDLLLNYDPQSLRLNKITPGSFFNKPQEFAKTIDNTNGKLIYSIGSITANANQATLVSLNFTPISSKKSQISINPKTIIISQGNPVSINLPPVLPIVID